MKDKSLKHETREGWLLAAVALMRPLFSDRGYTVPQVRVSCGWPSSRALSAKKRCLGEAWSKDASSEKIANIFITPWLEEKPDEDQGILPTLIHELGHATVGNKEGHNKVFGKCVRAVGLTGKLTSTHASKELLEQCVAWHKELGEFPHGKLDSNKRPKKKQTTRLIKCEDKASGYTVRITRKWLEEGGAPICPLNNKPMTYEIPDDLDFDGEGDNE